MKVNLHKPPNNSQQELEIKLKEIDDTSNLQSLTIELLLKSNQQFFEIFPGEVSIDVDKFSFLSFGSYCNISGFFNWITTNAGQKELHGLNLILDRHIPY